MTQTIRDNSFSPFDFTTYSATGITYSPKPTVIVAWLWLVPVVALWLLSAVLLVGAMWKTRRAGVKNYGV